MKSSSRHAKRSEESQCKVLRIDINRLCMCIYKKRGLRETSTKCLTEITTFKGMGVRYEGQTLSILCSHSSDKFLKEEACVFN